MQEIAKGITLKKAPPKENDSKNQDNSKGRSTRKDAVKSELASIASIASQIAKRRAEKPSVTNSPRPAASGKVSAQLDQLLKLNE